MIEIQMLIRKYLLQETDFRGICPHVLLPEVTAKTGFFTDGNRIIMANSRPSLKTGLDLVFCEQ
jgi:hypothetical protein